LSLPRIAIWPGVGARKALALPDRPGDRRGVERQLLLDLVENLEGSRLSRSILLMKVMIGMSRRRQTSNSFASGLDALGGVDHHDRASTAVSVR
jgi:hypothetical protein